MWVFCCGMNRSGSTLQYQLAASLVERLDGGRRMGGVWRRTFVKEFERRQSTSGLLVAKTHDCFPQAFELVCRGEAKAIFIHRDIRDVAVSYMSVTQHSFWSMIGRGFLERAIRNDAKWGRARQNVLVSQYDEVKASMREEVRRIANFLELDVCDAIIDKVATEHELQQSLARQREHRTSTDGERYHPSNYDAETLLLPNHITHGGSGRWKQELTSWQVALIEHIAGKWMKRRGYAFGQPAAKRRSIGWTTAPVRAAARVAADTLRRVMSMRKTGVLSETQSESPCVDAIQGVQNGRRDVA